MADFVYTSENSHKAPEPSFDAKDVATEFHIQKGLAGSTKDDILTDEKLSARADWYEQNIMYSKSEKVLKVLEDSKEAFKSLVDDGKNNGAGISTADIREFQRRATDAGKPGVQPLPMEIVNAMARENIGDEVQALTGPKQFQAAVMANFDIIDENNNGSLEPAEVAAAGNRSEEHSVLKTITGVMRKEFRALSEIADKPYELTREDFSRLTGYRPASTEPPPRFNPRHGLAIFGTGSALTTGLAAAALFDPEPVSKIALGTCAVIAGVYTGLAGVNTARAAIQENRYNESLKQPMVYPYRSINYFDQKRK